MFNPKGTTKEERKKERIAYLEGLVKECKISKAYIEQTMEMFGMDYESAMWAALDGW